MGFEAEIWAWRLGEGGRRRRRRRKFPCVKAEVIDPFGAAALLSPSISIMTYLMGGSVSTDFGNATRTLDQSVHNNIK